jgi:hypothetical protein
MKIFVLVSSIQQQFVLFFILLCCVTSFASAQALPPKKLEDFKKYIGFNREKLEEKLDAEGYAVEGFNEAGNFEEDYYAFDEGSGKSKKDPNDIMVLSINDVVSGIGTVELSYDEYLTILMEVENAGYTMTHQKVQVTGNAHWRGDIWKSNDKKWKVYVLYQVEDAEKISYNIIVSNNTLSWGTREDKPTGKLYDPRFTHFVVTYQDANFQGSKKMHIKGDEIKPMSGISSVKVPLGMRLTVYNSNDKNWEITSDQATLSSDWDNRIVGMDVENLNVEIRAAVGSMTVAAGAIETDATPFELEYAYVDEGLRLDLYPRPGLQGQSLTVWNSTVSDLRHRKFIVKSYRVSFTASPISSHQVVDKRKTAVFEALSLELNKTKGLIMKNDFTDRLIPIQDVTVEEWYDPNYSKWHETTTIAYRLQRGDTASYTVTIHYRPERMLSFNEIPSEFPGVRAVKISMDRVDNYRTTTWITPAIGRSKYPESDSFVMYFSTNTSFEVIKRLLLQLKDICSQ